MRKTPFFLSLLFFAALAKAQSPACPDGRETAKEGALEPRPCLTFQSLALEGEKLSQAVWNGSLFRNSSFRFVLMKASSFADAEFVNLEMRRTKLSSSNFEQSLWRGGRITDSDFSQNRFSSAQIRGTRWIRTDFSESVLQKSRWFQCYLEDVDFEGADLRGAVFEQCLFVRVKWSGAVFNKESRLPFSQSEMALRGMVYSP